jgi:hypothetical protein
MFTSATGDPVPGNYRPAAGSPLIDAGSNSFNDSKEDLDSRPRVFDGDGDGTALIDIGPYEFDSK